MYNDIAEDVNKLNKLKIRKKYFETVRRKFYGV